MNLKCPAAANRLQSVRNKLVRHEDDAEAIRELGLLLTSVTVPNAD